MILRIFFVFLAVCLNVGSVISQEEYPVTWHVYSEKKDVKNFDIVFEAYISKGWVIYALEKAIDGPVPTSFSFEENPEVNLLGDVVETIKPKSEFEPLFDIEVLKFSQKAVFTQKVFQLGKTNVVNGNIIYMACDGTKCLPPTNVPFVALLK